MVANSYLCARFSLQSGHWCQYTFGNTDCLFGLHILHLCGEYQLSKRAFFCFLTAISIQGGLKAVVWTDVVQTLIMFGAMVLIIVKGTIDVGGFGVVYQKAKESGRIESPKFVF